MEDKLINKKDEWKFFEFLHCGHNHYLKKTKILGIMRKSGNAATNILDRAKLDGRYLNFAGGNTVRSLIIMEEGTIVASSFTPQELIDGY